MSRYQHVALAPWTRDELQRGLLELGLAAEVAGADGLMLAGSLECAGEPVELRLPAGALGAVEDFGFVAGPAGFDLVCGEFDRARLERGLVAPLTQAVATARARRAAEAADLHVDEELLADGTRRLRLRPRR